MIEYPESRRLADQFLERLLGKQVQNVIPNQSPHKFAFFSGDPARYQGILQGKRVTGADAYGGIAELQLEDWKLLFADGTNLRYYPAGEPLPKKHQLHIEFTDFSALICSVQMYGMIFLIDEKEENDYYKSSKYKLKALDKGFDEAYFASLRQGLKASLSVKAFLATEQRIPGLGNGVLQDILFTARLHPKRKLQSLSNTEFAALYASVKEVLFQMTVKGGRDTEKDLYGNPGGYQTILSAKTKDKPCPVCGGETRREAYLGGNVYFCPVCQPLP